MELTTLDYFGLVANVAEISALILVLITIYFVSQEIKETRRIFTANAHSQIGISGSEFLATIYTNAELQLVWSKGLKDASLLTEAETARFYMVLLSYWTLLANGFYLAQVDDSIVARIEGMLDLMVSRKSVRDWWHAGNYNPSPEFGAYVDARIQHLIKSGVIDAGSV
ncbi:MAG: hypothetical protein ACI9FR_001372 [Cryomorphaceae bacterium]|jgi:hypothetical protein